MRENISLRNEKFREITEIDVQPDPNPSLINGSSQCMRLVKTKSFIVQNKLGCTQKLQKWPVILTNNGPLRLK